MVRSRKVDSADLAPKRRRLRRWHFWGAALSAGTLILILVLPQILTQRSLLVPLINQFAGIAPLQVDLAAVQAGWLAPVSASGLKLVDQDGKTVAKIARIQTDKGVLGWIWNSQDLGIIRIQKLEAALEVGNGTSNIERLLEPILAAQPEADSDAAPLTGAIELEDAQFLLTETGRQEQWVVQLPRLSMALPKADQILGPIELQASIGEATGVVSDSRGSLTARVEQVGDAFEIVTELNHLPADFYHLARARLPSLPIDALKGYVSGRISARYSSETEWNVGIDQFATQGLAVAAESLLGPQPALIESLAVAGKAKLSGNRLSIDGAQIVCDFGTCKAAAQIGWPIQIPTAAEPFLQASTFEVEGTVDLPKLIHAAASLLPMRDGTELQGGVAQFRLSQQMDAQQSPSAQTTLTLSGLHGVAGGQSLQWSEPLMVELTARRPATGLELAAKANAEFVHLQGAGTMAQGQIGGDVDLALLHQKISQWIELPIDNMTGSAGVEMSWQSVTPTQVDIVGKLTTTALSLTTDVGGQILEPAWQGAFQGAARLDQGTPTHVERAKLELTSSAEQLVFDLREPLALQSTSQPKLAPSAFTLTLTGDMANWKRRAMVWLAEPPTFEIAGNVSLVVGGRADLQHLEIQQASWRAKPLQFKMPQFGLSESEMVGGFQGNVDTSDLTKLKIESLTVNTTSFSLGARDSASQDGSGRLGRASFRMNLGRLLTNLNSGTAALVLPATAIPTANTSQLSATGEIEGDLAWSITSQAASMKLIAQGKEIVLLNKTPEAIAATPLWQEPTLGAELEGNWDAATGNIDLRDLKLRTDWCTYAGSLNYETVAEISQIVSKGEAVVETSRLSTKLAPLTANQVQMVGSQTVPIEAVWKSNPDPQAPALAGLQAKARIGWDQAKVVGVAVGKADVPVTVDAGVLKTAAEIPVSGGVLRWDVTSDLTAEEMVLVQQPMTVLENVEITDEMSKGWLKYVTPLIAEATSVDGRLSLALSQANLIPTNPRKQTVAGQLIMHSAEVGPGPLSNQVITMVKQLDAIRKKDFTQAVSSQAVWLRMPEQRIDFQMIEGRVIHRNLNVRVGDVTMATSGSVDVSGQMDLMGSMPIPDDWVDKSPWLATLRGQSLQIPVRGSLTAPQTDSSAIQQLVRQSVQGAAQGVLEKGLSRGLERLFGPNGIAPPSIKP